MRKTDKYREMLSLLSRHPEITGHLAKAARLAFDKENYARVEEIFNDARSEYPALFGVKVGIKAPTPAAQISSKPPPGSAGIQPVFITISRQGHNLQYAWQDREDGRQMLPFRADRLVLKELPDRLSQIYRHASGSGSSQGQSALLEEVQHLGGLVYSSLVPDRVREIMEHAAGGLHLYLDLDAAAVPWEFLWNGRDFLSLKAPLTRQLSLCREKSLPATRSKSILAAGSTGNGSLPLVADEIDQIAGLYRKCTFPADSAVDDFRRADLLSWTAGHGVIHYSGHSETNARGGNFWMCSDGKLRAKHLAMLDRLPKLVFANCCGGAALGGQMMAQQLLVNGVRNYISPLWKVPDHIALNFANDFHKHLLDGKNISQALFLARKNSSDQAGWAGYLAYCQPDRLIGDIL